MTREMIHRLRGMGTMNRFFVLRIAAFYVATLASSGAKALETTCLTGILPWGGPPSLTVYSETNTDFTEYYLSGTMVTVSVTWDHSTSKLAAVINTSVPKPILTFAFAVDYLQTGIFGRNYRLDTDAYFPLFGGAEDSCNGSPGPWFP